MTAPRTLLVAALLGLVSPAAAQLSPRPLPRPDSDQVLVTAGAGAALPAYPNRLRADGPQPEFRFALQLRIRRGLYGGLGFTYAAFSPPAQASRYGRVRAALVGPALVLERPSRLAPYLRVEVGPLLYRTVRLGFSDGELVEGVSRSAGWQTGLGVGTAVGLRLRARRRIQPFAEVGYLLGLVRGGRMAYVPLRVGIVVDVYYAEATGRARGGGSR